MENIILAILQARTSSSRLPNKALKPILGKAMLLHQIERTQRSKTIDKLVVATSTDSSDDAIEKLCRDNNIAIFRGDLDNVLDRFYRCAKTYNPKYVVRLTGDCPLTDYQVIDNAIEYCLKNGFDYVATALTFPNGLDVEVFTMDVLSEAYKKASLPSEREHVTQGIRKMGNKFKLGELNFDKDLSSMRWTVDMPEDFILVEKIYQKLHKNNPNFLTDDILKLLEKEPGLKEINNSFVRNEGLEKSLKEDQQFLKNQNDY